MFSIHKKVFLPIVAVFLCIVVLVGCTNQPTSNNPSPEQTEAIVNTPTEYINEDLVPADAIYDVIGPIKIHNEPENGVYSAAGSYWILAPGYTGNKPPIGKSIFIYYYLNGNDMVGALQNPYLIYGWRPAPE